MDRKVNKLVEIVLSVTRPEKIILFGSYASKKETANSDIDLLIVVNNETNRREVTREIYKKLIGFGHPVDIVVVNKSTLEANKTNFSLVYYHALKEGVQVYEEAA